MPGFVFGVFAVIALAAIGAYYYFSEGQQIRRALRTAPQVRIADFPDRAPAKISGTLQYEAQPLTSPLTGRSCAHYEAVVQELRSRGKHRSWVTIIRDVASVPFRVVDGSGTAIVDPTGARIAVVIDAHTKSGTFDPATPMEEAFLNKHGRDSKGWFFNKTLRFREGVLAQGEQVAVLGHGTKEPDPEGVARADAYRSLPPMRVRLGGSPSFPILISDDPSTLGA